MRVWLAGCIRHPRGLTKAGWIPTQGVPDVVAVVNLAGVELKRCLLDVYSGAMLRDVRLLAFDADQISQ